MAGGSRGVGLVKNQANMTRGEGLFYSPHDMGCTTALQILPTTVTDGFKVVCHDFGVSKCRG